MIDGLWSGILGGLFGAATTQWLSRFRYWAIFFISTIAVHIGLFVALLYSSGLDFAIQAVKKNTFTPVGIFVPIGIGLLVVSVVFVSSTLRKHGKNQSHREDG